MAQYELFQGDVYRYTLGVEEDPSEALDKEQARGARRLSIVKVEGGKRTPFLVGSDEPEPEEEYDFGEEEEEFST